MVKIQRSDTAWFGSIAFGDGVQTLILNCYGFGRGYVAERLLGAPPLKGYRVLMGDKVTTHTKTFGSVWASGLIPIYDGLYGSLLSPSGQQVASGFSGREPLNTGKPQMGSVTHDMSLLNRSNLEFDGDCQLSIGEDGSAEFIAHGFMQFRQFDTKLWRYVTYKGDIDITRDARLGSGTRSHIVELRSDEGTTYRWTMYTNSILLTVNAYPTSSYYLGYAERLRNLQMQDILAATTVEVPGIYADLVTRAVKKCQAVTCNSLAYIHDAYKLRDDVKALITAVKGVRNPKNWANLWLSYRYGLPLFIQDSHEIITASKKMYAEDNVHSIQTIRSSRTRKAPGVYSGEDVHIEGHMKVYLDNRPAIKRKLIKDLHQWDLVPDLENIWDFIPYSFVLDWVIPVGDLLTRLDAANYVSVFPILGALYSVKLTVSSTALPPPWHGHITTKWYSRAFADASQLARLPLTFSGLRVGSGICNVKHGIDALCMAYQRKSR